VSNYISKIKAIVGKTYKEMVAATLATTVSGCVQLFPTNLPADNYFFGRQMEIYEGDIQDTPNNSITIDLKPGFEGRPTGLIVEPLESIDNQKLPFDISIEGIVNTSGESSWNFTFSDNNEDYVSGAIYSVRVLGVSKFGLPKEELFHITYLSGNSPGNLTSRVDDLETSDNGNGNGGNGILYIVGDGICETSLGENITNSPIDCATMNGDGNGNGILYIVGDGICETSLGEDITNSPIDCAVSPMDGNGGGVNGNGNGQPPVDNGQSLDDLLRQSSTNFFDNTGTLIPSVGVLTSNYFSVVTIIPRELYDLGGVKSFEFNELTDSCIFVGGYGDPINAPIRFEEENQVSYVVDAVLVTPENCNSTEAFIEVSANVIIDKDNNTVPVKSQVLVDLLNN